MSAIWKDATKYSQGQKDRVPTVYEARTPSLRVVVHRGRAFPGTWLLFVGELHVVQHDLHTDDHVEAKARALSFLSAHLQRLVAEIDELSEAPS